MTLAQQVGDRLYRQGDQGIVVRAIQQALAGLGYALTGTGFFGGATDAAVTAFQRRAGVTADGIVGAMTAKAIDHASVVAPQKETPAVALEIARPLWLTYGLTQIGTKETPGAGDNRTIIDWAKDEGGSIARDYTHDSIPWCALFANHILTKCGIKGTETLWALDFAGKWPAVKLNGPAVGAFAPMLRDGGGHIICIVGRDQNGNIMGLGGNQHDAVNIAAFPPSRLNKGFWWPVSIPTPFATGITSLPIVKSDGKVSTKES